MVLTQFGAHVLNTKPACQLTQQIELFTSAARMHKTGNRVFTMFCCHTGYTLGNISQSCLPVYCMPDIILLDLQMPGMNGDEALAQIRSEVWGKKIPVIILTNTGKEEAPQGLGALGIEGYIVKAEMTPKQVVSRVKESLDKN